MQYNIEKCIPIPEKFDGCRAFHHQMEVGDSIGNISLSKVRSMQSSISNAGGKSLTRKQPDGTYRIWLTVKPPSKRPTNS